MPREKKVTEILKAEGINITTVVNVMTVDFLDIRFSLLDSTFRPYHKPNSKVVYVSAGSNHPPSILKNIPLSVSNRLKNISANKELFEEEKGHFQDAINDAGYDFRLNYYDKSKRKGPSISSKSGKRKRGRNIIWFNPPWNSFVDNSIGKKFLDLIDSHFKHDDELSKLFNRHNVKVSYRCGPNLESLIKSHNMKILKSSRDKNADKERTCDCNKNSTCPVNNKCLEKKRYIQS